MTISKNFIVIALVISFFLLMGFNYMKNDSNSKDLVPTKETAIKIAEAIWLPIYGEKIYNRMPFIAKEMGDSWEVKGTLMAKKEGVPYTIKGGVPYIKIRKSDCKILKVTHSK